MQPNRRTFLRTSATLAAALPFARLTAAPVAPAPATDGTLPRGLLFDPPEVPRLRRNLADPRFARLRATLLDADLAGETRFLRDELRLNNHSVDFLRAWKVLQRASFAHTVSKDPRQLEVARLALRRLCDYRRWDYFLEGGRDTIGLQRAPEATIATCLALDWLGDALPADEREAAEHSIATKGAPACYLTLYGMKYPDRVRGWGFDPEDDYAFRFDLSRWPLILNSTNLKVIPICGLGFAALWLHGRHPQADQWMQMARQSAQAFATMYGLDGAYDEGVGYWGYTTQHLALFAEALHRRLGIDDRGLINYRGTVRFALAMAMPCATTAAHTGDAAQGYVPALDVVNFCDTGTGMDVTIAPWVGRVTGDPLSHYVARHIGSLAEIPAVVWYDEAAPSQPPGPELLDVRLSNDWVVSRTGWAPEDGVVALRSGGPANHEHADRNSVIFKAHGERLLHDPFRAGYSHTVPRWLLRQTEAHTAVLINGRGHQYHDGREGTNASWATARVTDFRTGPGWMTVTSDATEAYALAPMDVTRVTRTLVYVKPDVLLILDQVKLPVPAPVQLRYQVFNDDQRGEVAVDADRFTIRRPLATLQAQLYSRGGLHVRAGRLELPADEGVYPYAEAASAAAPEHLLLTVCTAAPAGEAHPPLGVTAHDGGWQVRGTHRGVPVQADLALSPSGTVVVTL
jgi:hypothetical protein